MPQSDHFILVGDSPLSRNSYQELTRRGLGVRVILQAAVTDSFFHPEDVIIGDASDVDVLREAGAESAQAVLALRTDDAENAFVVLAVKELQSAAKTVAAVSDSKNIKRMERVQPDLLIAPQVMGGEILAMALNGETLNHQIILRLFQGH
ncbi:MAG: NAD-binding protein [Acidithiobacillus sp.]|nr:NAD-binding protein [Acidithiobacillus sp.]